MDPHMWPIVNMACSDCWAVLTVLKSPGFEKALALRCSLCTRSIWCIIGKYFCPSKLDNAIKGKRYYYYFFFFFDLPYIIFCVERMGNRVYCKINIFWQLFGVSSTIGTVATFRQLIQHHLLLKKQTFRSVECLQILSIGSIYHHLVPCSSLLSQKLQIKECSMLCWLESWKGRFAFMLFAFLSVAFWLLCRQVVVFSEWDDSPSSWVSLVLKGWVTSFQTEPNPFTALVLINTFLNET